jgi:hypothetical protein
MIQRLVNKITNMKPMYSNYHEKIISENHLHHKFITLDGICIIKHLKWGPIH